MVPFHSFICGCPVFSTQLIEEIDFSSLRVGLYQWLVKVSWLGKLVSVFWWVELEFFSLECSEVSSNELWDVNSFGVNLGSLYIEAQSCVPVLLENLRGMSCSGTCWPLACAWFQCRYGLPWWLRWENVCLQWGKPGFNPWVRKISWRRKWQSTPVLLPGKSHGQKSLVGYSPWGCKDHTWLSHVPVCMEAFDEFLLINVPWSQEFSDGLRI